MNCSFCGSELTCVLDLGTAPPSNSFLTMYQLDEPETYYPLKLFFCPECRLVQVPQYRKAEDIFKEDYAYYSSQSPSNVSHAKEYVEMIMNRFTPKRVLEIGGNDGYLLQHFPDSGGVLNIEPSEGPARESAKKGINTTINFFSTSYVKECMKGCDALLRGEFDLICGINVLAHQPDINDFVAGLKIALAPKGIITMEFPHVMNLVDQCQFDTIYHEHYSYFSMMTICHIFAEHGLEIFDVDEIPEHGGSLRIYAHHELAHTFDRSKAVALIRKEQEKGMSYAGYYQLLPLHVGRIKRDLLAFLIQEETSKIAYGCAAKGNTLLNYCGIKSDLIWFAVDKSPHKIGKYLPGSRIPVFSEDAIRRNKPRYVLILPWNLKTEIMEQLSYIREWGGKFVVAIPELEVL